MQQDSVIANVYDRIKEVGHDEVHVVGDFLDLGGYHAVRKALLRLEEAGKIQKIMRGVYYYPQYSELIGEFEAPSPGKVADTLARKFGWTIAPCADTALNLFGLSTQVPAKWSYISDGPYHEFQIEAFTIEFRHKNNREISGISRQTATVIQALKAIGKDNVTDAQMDILRHRLSDNEKTIMLKEAQQATVWVYDLIKLICQ